MSGEFPPLCANCSELSSEVCPEVCGNNPNCQAYGGGGPRCSVCHGPTDPDGNCTNDHCGANPLSSVILPKKSCECSESCSAPSQLPYNKGFPPPIVITLGEVVVDLPPVHFISSVPPRPKPFLDPVAAAIHEPGVFSYRQFLARLEAATPPPFQQDYARAARTALAIQREFPAFRPQPAFQPSQSNSGGNPSHYTSASFPAGTPDYVLSSEGGHVPGSCSSLTISYGTGEGGSLGR